VVNNRLRRRRSGGFAGITALVVFSLVALSAGLLALIGLLRLHSRDAPVPDQKVVGTEAEIERGENLVATYCEGCHSETQPLSGDVIVGNSPPLDAEWHGAAAADSTDLTALYEYLATVSQTDRPVPDL
jgi:hypothetical protein